MFTFEYISLAITYTSLIISLFLQIICFKRKIESWQTILLTISLLLLVVSISISPLFKNEETTIISTMCCMVFVGITTALDTLNNQIHSLPKKTTQTLILLASILGISIFVGFYIEQLNYVQYVVVGFLIITVAGSMILMRMTKPVKKYQHRNKANRIFAIVFLILVPIYLIVHYSFEQAYEQFQFGFLLYFAFTALAISKIYDDLQRLSLINISVEPKKQHFKNHGLTQREEEIATLLLKGGTYKSIADELFISLPTVKTHASNIYKKCGVKSRSELAVLFN